MGKLRGLGTIVVLLVCGGAAYQGWSNSRIPHEVDARAAEVACDELHVCDGTEPQWASIDAGPFVRTYRIDAGRGAVTLECRWASLMFGAVTCTADREDVLRDVSEKPARRPHEIPRGNRERR